MTAITFQAIGVVHSDHAEIHDRDWSEVTATIHIKPALAPGLHRIAENSHIVVIYYLHKSRFDPDKDLVRHPMDREDIAKRGVFATRSNYRPNYIGLKTVKLLAVDDNRLTVQGLDALEGTPVLDIKPYLPRMDCPPDAVVPDFGAG